MGRLPRTAAIVLAALAVALPAPAAIARAHCLDRDKIVAALAKNYGERRVAYGLQRDLRLLEIYASADTGTWTAVLVGLDMCTRIVASGEAWTGDLPAPPAGEPL